MRICPWFLVFKINLLRSSKSSQFALLSVEMVSLRLLGVVTTASASLWMALETCLDQAPAIQGTNEHVMRAWSSPVSGTAVVLSPPAGRHSMLAICWQVHISHCGELKWLSRQKKSFISSSLRIPRLWFGIKHLLHDPASRPVPFLPQRLRLEASCASTGGRKFARRLDLVRIKASCHRISFFNYLRRGSQTFNVSV